MVDEADPDLRERPVELPRLPVRGCERGDGRGHELDAALDAAALHGQPGESQVVAVVELAARERLEEVVHELGVGHRSSCSKASSTAWKPSSCSCVTWASIR